LARVPPEAEYWLALSRLPGVGRLTYLKLLKTYESPRAALALSDEDWRRDGTVHKSFDSSAHREQALNWAHDQVESLKKSEWSLIVLGDPRFPQPLMTLHHPPPFLFTWGTAVKTPALAVVGARQMTDYGVRMTREIVSDLAAAGVTIVSGFASGIDTVAHKAALDAGGMTVAVWGSGPDILYPSENKDLAPRIAAHGMILTEFPFGSPPEAHHFPIRNRLIAGLADGVLVTQARQRSGALLTAGHALEQGKNVYAVPAEVGNPQYVGSNELLKSGARLVTEADDILSDFHLVPVSRTGAPALPLPPLSDVERRVYEGLGGSPCHIDRLAVSLGMSAGECASVVVSLELKGLIKQAAGGFISQARS
jgi:DNA processing protein